MGYNSNKNLFQIKEFGVTSYSTSYVFAFTKAVSNKLLVYHPKSLKKLERGGGFIFYFFLINFRGVLYFLHIFRDFFVLFCCTFVKK